jgi:hypothetical protein
VNGYCRLRLLCVVVALAARISGDLASIFCIKLEQLENDGILRVIFVVLAYRKKPLNCAKLQSTGC